MTTHGSEYDEDEAWLDLRMERLGRKASMDQVDEFCERVAALVWAGEKPNDARLKAFRELF
jgi:hypothetical protein